MAPEYSKQVLEQIQQARELVGAVQTHHQRILEKLLSRLVPHLDKNLDPQAFAYFVHQATTAFVRLLEAETQSMGQADLAHTYRLLHTQQAREKRETTLEDTFKKVYSVKMAILAYHGEEALQILGISGETPRVPSDLLRWLEQLLNVAQQGVVLPASNIPTMEPWSANKIIQAVSPVLTQLHSALSEVSQKQHDEKDTLTTKWQCMELQNYAYTCMASLSEACAHLAGEHDLGERLRPRNSTRSARKKGKDKSNKSTTSPQSDNGVSPDEGPSTTTASSDMPPSLLT